LTDEYITHRTGLIKLLSYHKIDCPVDRYHGDLVGYAYLEIKYGLVSNFVECNVLAHQVDGEGIPILSKLDPASNIYYYLHEKIEACIQDLCLLGYFEDSIRISSLYPRGFKRRISVGSWVSDAPQLSNIEINKIDNDNYSAPLLNGFTDYLLESLENVEKKLGVFSKDWYLLKICLLYFKEAELTADDFFNIGLLFAQMTAKFNMEELAIRGQKNISSLEAASNSRLKNNEQKKAKILKRIEYMWYVLREGNPELARKDKTAAEEIYLEAKVARPEELIIKSTGKIMAERTIRAKLAILRRSGRIG